MVFKVLLLGSTGYIGGQVAKCLDESKESELYQLVRKSSKNLKNVKNFGQKLYFTKTDKTITKDDLLQITNEHKITHLIDLTWLRYDSTFEKNLQNNKQLMNDLVSICALHNITFINVVGNFHLLQENSSGILGCANKAPIDPKTFKVSKYTKLFENEEIFNVEKEYCVNEVLKKCNYKNSFTVLICSVYGKSPNGLGVWSELYIKWLLSNKPNELFPNLKDLYTTWIDVRDLADYLLNAIKYGKNGQRYLVSNNETLSPAQICGLFHKNGLKWKNSAKWMKELIIGKNELNLDWDTESAKKELRYNCKYSLKDNKNNGIKDWISGLQNTII